MLCFSLLAISCEKQKENVAHIEDYSSQLIAMQQLIEQGVEYDITDVEAQIYGSTGYWRLDAVLGYNADFSQVTTIYRDFAAEGDEEQQGVIYLFGSNSEITCYDLGEADGRIEEQAGEWSYEPRTLTLTLCVPQFGDNQAVDLRCKLLSLSNDAIVLEWIADSGESLRASLVPASISELFIAEANCVMEKLMESCRDFDKVSFAETLPGTWSVDSEMTYDSEWRQVVEPYRLMGMDYAEGGASLKYNFAADGEGLKEVEAHVPGEEPSVKNFTWTYNVDDSRLILNFETSTMEYLMSGYDGEYIVLDYQSQSKNTRFVLKRK